MHGYCAYLYRHFGYIIIHFFLQLILIKIAWYDWYQDLIGYYLSIDIQVYTSILSDACTVYKQM
jgi:hypothetical protein